MKYFFTSDCHFWHKRVIEYSNRPFDSVEEMNAKLIAGWNGRVGKTDMIFVLGDLFFCGKEKALEILAQLNGRKILIYGNHDKAIKKSAEIKAHFEHVDNYHELRVQDATMPRGSRLICMSHYPMTTWNEAHHGSFMLHGHSHGTLKYPFSARIMDVGVDPLGYKPISYQEVHQRLSVVTPTFNDHHREG